MARRADATGSRRIAVGSSRDHASRVFGAHHADVFLTTYDALAGEVDLTGPLEVDLACGPGDEAAVRTLLQHLEGRSLRRLRVQYVAGDPHGLRRQLEAHPGVGIRSVVPLGPALLLDLVATDSPVVTANQLVLQAVDVAGGGSGVPGEPVIATRGTEAPESRSQVPPAAARAALRPPRKAPVETLPPVTLRLLGRLLGPLWRAGARPAAAAVAGGVGVATMVLVVVAGLTAGTDGILVVLVLLTWLLLLGLTGLVLLLQRDVHHQRVSVERMLRRQGRMIRRRTNALSSHAAVLRRGQAGVPHVMRYLEAIDSAGSGLRAQLGDWFGNADTTHTRLHLETQRQMQAHLVLERVLGARPALPPLGGWAASADLMVVVLEELTERRPRLVVECGSGVSTVMMALALRAGAWDCRIVSLEHRADFKAATEELLVKHGVDDLVDVRLAPLVTGHVDGHDTPWYDPSALQGLTDVGLVLVDGPPTLTGPLARYPVVPLLRDRLAPDCVIIADDLVRESDLQCARQWHEILPDFTFEVDTTLQKHAAILRRQAPSAR